MNLVTTDGRTDQPTDGPTLPGIELLSQLKIYNFLMGKLTGNQQKNNTWVNNICKILTEFNGQPQAWLQEMKFIGPN